MLLINTLNIVVIEHRVSIAKNVSVLKNVLKILKWTTEEMWYLIIWNIWNALKAYNRPNIFGSSSLFKSLHVETYEEILPHESENAFVLLLLRNVAIDAFSIFDNSMGLVGFICVEVLSLLRIKLKWFSLCTVDVAHRN